MVVWTPSQWERELDNFAARVQAKDYDRIPYTNWQTLFGFTKLNPSKKIVLAIDSTGKMTLTASNHQFNMNCYVMLPLKSYLEDTYYELPVQAAARLAFNVNDLMAYKKVELSNSNYATVNTNTVLNTNYATTTDWTYTNKSDTTGYIVNGTYSDVISNSNLLNNQSFKHEYEAIWQTTTVTIDNEKEKKDMNFFKNFEFGPVKNDAVRLSPYGLAVKNLDGSWVSYDGTSDSIIDVDVFNFEGKNLIYKIPVAPHTVRAGDMIVHQGKGMYVVADVCEGDTCISVIDPRAGESKEILFTKSPFGFTFIVKLVSLLDMSGIEANPDNPFGNLLPLAMMGDKDCDAATMMAFMMMNNSEGCNFDMSNPMMMYALMSGDNKDMLLPMMLMANRK